MMRGSNINDGQHKEVTGTLNTNVCRFKELAEPLGRHELWADEHM
jgi:hypothetical protein